MYARAALSLASLVALVAACSADPGSPSSFDTPTAPGNDPTFGGGNGDAGGIKNPNVTADSGASEQCAKSSVTPTPIPVQLVFMFDKSGSMGDMSKWSSCKTGLNAFFGDPASKGAQASIQFFPQSNQECSASTYETPAVSMRALPNTTDFSTAIGNNSPGGGTPTLPALAGAMQYAQKQALLNPSGKSAIVLVTDGLPNDCSSTVSGVAQQAQTAYKAGIPVFVIGVGNTGNLDQIAKSGGTTAATIVNTNNAQQTAQDFQKALNAIRASTLACEYQIPQLPQGATVSQVNVDYTPSGGVTETMTYDANCTGTTHGWHYDDPKNPTKIMLCKSTCQDVQKDASGKVDLVLGCATKGGIPN